MNTPCSTLTHTSHPCPSSVEETRLIRDCLFVGVDSQSFQRSPSSPQILSVGSYWHTKLRTLPSSIIILFAMRLLLVFLLVLLASLTLAIPTIVGGFSPLINFNSDQGFQTVNSAIVLRWPFLGKASVVSVSVQVVAGINYKIQYQDGNHHKYEVVVFSQPWTNTIQIVSAVQL